MIRFIFAICMIVFVVGCQTDETNSQQSTENEELITEVPATSDSPLATAEPATAVPPTEESTEPVEAVPVTEPIEAEPVETVTVAEPVEAEPIDALANADVVFVRAVNTGDETWTFHVTVDHPDTGWEDYADGWDVVLPDGSVVKPDETSPFTRLLAHPHETERPFTRSQSNIIIPASITSVTVRAHDLVDGFGGKEVVVDLTAVSGTDFEIER